MDLLAYGTSGAFYVDYAPKEPGEFVFEAETGEPFLMLTNQIITRLDGGANA